MAGYIGSTISVVSPGAEQRFKITASAGQNIFTGLAYKPGFEHVYQNGVRLVSGTDYAAATGNSINLVEPATAGDEVVVIAFGTFNAVDAYTKAESDVRHGVNTSGVTFPLSPNFGDEVWRTDLEAFFKYNGSSWIEI